MRAICRTVGALLFCYVCGHGQSFELSGGETLALGGAVEMIGAGPVDRLTIPAAGHETSLSFQTDYVRRYELTDLASYTAAVSFRHSSMISAVGFSQFGRSDLYSEKTFRLMLGAAAGTVSVGALVSGRMYEFGGGYPDLSAGALGLGGSWRYRRFALGLTADNLNRPRLSEADPVLGRRVSIFTEYSGPGEFELVGRVTVQEDREIRVAVGQQIALSSKARILWGVHSAPLEYGGALQVTVSGFELTLAGSYHPVLGLSSAAGLTAPVGSPRKE